MANVTKTQAVTVVVRNLPAGTGEAQLRTMCAGLGQVVEVDIPGRTARFDKFIYGFVRFVDLETARMAVRELSGKTVGTRKISAQIARGHWRNTNEDTVGRVGARGGERGEVDEEHDEDLNMSEEEIQTAIIQESRRQWYQHRRRHPSKELPSFESILEAVCSLPSS